LNRSIRLSPAILLLALAARGCGRGGEERPLAPNPPVQARPIGGVTKVGKAPEAEAQERRIQGFFRAASDFLARHQDRNAAGDRGAFPSECIHGSCRDSGHASDLENTGLALLCLGIRGNTYKHGRHKRVVERALDFLRKQQAADGGFGGDEGTRSEVFVHAICTAALAHAMVVTGSPQRPPEVFLQAPCRLATGFLLARRAPKAGWGRRPGEPPDSLTTCWAMWSLRMASEAGVDVPRQTADEVLDWLDSRTDPLTFHVGFRTVSDRGTNPERPGGNPMAPTAGATWIRFLWGGANVRENPGVKGAGDLMLDNLPNVEGDRAAFDLEYWFFGVCANEALGGSYRRAWIPVRTGLLQMQRNEGCEGGSWDPEGFPARSKGRLWTTALIGGVVSEIPCYNPLFQHPQAQLEEQRGR
jgi:hypothetical protein